MVGRIGIPLKHGCHGAPMIQSSVPRRTAASHSGLDQAKIGTDRIKEILTSSSYTNIFTSFEHLPMIDIRDITLVRYDHVTIF